MPYKRRAKRKGSNDNINTASNPRNPVVGDVVKYYYKKKGKVVFGYVRNIRMGYTRYKGVKKKYFKAEIAPCCSDTDYLDYVGHERPSGININRVEIYRTKEWLLKNNKIPKLK